MNLTSLDFYSLVAAHRFGKMKKQSYRRVFCFTSRLHFFYPSRIYTIETVQSNGGGIVQVGEGWLGKTVCRKGGNLLDLHVHTRNVK